MMTGSFVEHVLEVDRAVVGAEEAHQRHDFDSGPGECGEMRMPHVLLETFAGVVAVHGEHDSVPALGEQPRDAGAHPVRLPVGDDDPARRQPRHPSITSQASRITGFPMSSMADGRGRAPVATMATSGACSATNERSTVV